MSCLLIIDLYKLCFRLAVWELGQQVLLLAACCCRLGDLDSWRVGGLLAAWRLGELEGVGELAIADLLLC